MENLWMVVVYIKAHSHPIIVRASSRVDAVDIALKAITAAYAYANTNECRIIDADVITFTNDAYVLSHYP